MCVIGPQIGMPTASTSIAMCTMRSGSGAIAEPSSSLNISSKPNVMVLRCTTHQREMSDLTCPRSATSACARSSGGPIRVWIASL